MSQSSNTCTCSIDEVLNTVNTTVWSSLNEYYSTHKKMVNPLNRFRDKINEYFKMEKIDGTAFKNMNLNTFVSALSYYIKSINKKQIEIALQKLYIFIEDYHSRCWTRLCSQQHHSSESKLTKKINANRYAAIVSKKSAEKNAHVQTSVARIQKRNPITQIWTCTMCNTPNNILEVLQKGDRTCLGCDFPVPNQYLSVNSNKMDNKSTLIHLGPPTPIVESKTDDMKYEELYNSVEIEYFFPRDIKFKWDKDITHISDCNHIYFLYVTLRTIDKMNRIIGTEENIKITINKQKILIYVHKIELTGNIFYHSRSHFIKA
eukprot:388144_1